MGYLNLFCGHQFSAFGAMAFASVCHTGWDFPCFFWVKAALLTQAQIPGDPLGMPVQRCPGSHARAPGLLPPCLLPSEGSKMHSAGRLPGATEPNARTGQASKRKSLGGWATTQNGFAFAQFPLTGSPKELPYAERDAPCQSGKSFLKLEVNSGNRPICPGQEPPQRAEACIRRVA